MKHSLHRVLSVVAMLTSVSVVSAQGVRVPEQQLLQDDNNRFNAMVEGNVAALNDLLAVELTYIHANARVDDKRAFIYGIKSGDTKYLKITLGERQTHVVGTFAIVTGVATVLVVDRGENLDQTIRYTNVEVFRNDRWQMISGQATRLVPSSKVIPGGPP